MMPLWISASLPSTPPLWGCAFSSVGAPWVAQRVCPMAVLDSGSGTSARALMRLASFPARLVVTTRSPATRATPAESSCSPASSLRRAGADLATQGWLARLRDDVLLRLRDDVLLPEFRGAHHLPM